MGTKVILSSCEVCVMKKTERLYKNLMEDFLSEDIPENMKMEEDGYGRYTIWSWGGTR